MRLKALKTHFLLESNIILLATKATVPRQRLAGQQKGTLLLALNKSKKLMNCETVTCSGKQRIFLRTFPFIERINTENTC